LRRACPACYAAVMVVAFLTSPVLPNMVLPGVPTYSWYYGCAPTSAGMMVGYWDGLPGGGDLFYGDASVESQATRDMIASPQHIADPYCRTHSANSIADFMRTNLQGYTDYASIGLGLRQYIEWDNPNTPVNEGYEASVVTHTIGLLGGDMTWDLFKGEIEEKRPVMLNVVAFHDGVVYGHTVVGYGYQEDMFQNAVVHGGQQGNLTVGGYAVRDTWPARTSQSDWYGWDLLPVTPIIDVNGVEWWPWVEVQGLPGDALWAWTVYQGISVEIGIPEPATFGWLGTSFLVIVLRRSRGRPR